MSQSDASHEQMYSRACAVLPGGVNSPVRAYRAVGGVPVFAKRARGAWVTSEEGRDYIDYVASWGPMLFGHAAPFVVEAVERALRDGTSFGMPTKAETELAELVAHLVPSVEMVRFVNSGTEACASVVRLARGATGRKLIIKCAGCYHGAVDSLLARAGSGVATLGMPDSAGVPAGAVADTAVVEFNDEAGLRQIFEIHGAEIAAFILEPVPGNMGLVPPLPGYLELARKLTREVGALLIFDEVMTGFRVAAGGAQALYGITPDLTTLGKIVGGGLPVAAYGGRRNIMMHLAPEGPVYQAGTLSGNPLGMAAGLAMLREIERRGDALYNLLETRTDRLTRGISVALSTQQITHVVQRCGSMFTVFFTPSSVSNFSDAQQSDTSRFAKFFHEMLDQGVQLPPSQFECAFVSAAHDDDIINKTTEAAQAAAKGMT